MATAGDVGNAAMVAKSEGEGSESTDVCLYFTVVEELFVTKPAPATGRMKRSVWRWMPQELVERVLLFLPASSQARFAIVCKRWREAMSTSAFREESAFIAFCSSDTVCLCSLLEPCVILGDRLTNIKVVKVGLGMIPVELRQLDGRVQVFTHGGLLGFAVETGSPSAVRICVLNPANSTWRELPPVMLDRVHVGWYASIAAYKQQEECKFQVFVAWAYLENNGCNVGLQNRFNVYSSVTNAWSTAIYQPYDQLTQYVPFSLADYVVSRGGLVHTISSEIDDSYAKGVLRITLDGRFDKKLPEPPRGKALYIGSGIVCCHLGASYYRETMYWVRNTCSIYKCGKSSRTWKLLSRLPKDLRSRMGCMSSSRCQLLRAQVVGNLVMLVCVPIPEASGQYVVAYHIAKKSWCFVGQVPNNWEFHWFLATRPELGVGL